MISIFATNTCVMPAPGTACLRHTILPMPYLPKNSRKQRPPVSAVHAKGMSRRKRIPGRKSWLFSTRPLEAKNGGADMAALLNRLKTFLFLPVLFTLCCPGLCQERTVAITVDDLPYAGSTQGKKVAPPSLDAAR